MENNAGFAYAYGWNMYYQKILGVCAMEGEGLIARKRAWCWVLIIILFISIPQMSSLPILWGDLTLVVNCLSTNMSMIISLVKIIVLQFQREVIGSITVNVSKDWMNVRRKDEFEIMSKFATISRFNSIVSFSLTNIAVLTLVISQFWVALEEVNNPDRDPRLTLGFLCDSYFPFDMTVLSTYIPLYIGQLAAALLAAMAVAGVDCYVVTIVLHLCGQLVIVRHSLKSLVTETTLRCPRKYWQRLRIIVEKHVEIIRRASVIEETFSSVLLIHMVICTATLCFQGYVLFLTLMGRSGNTLALPVIILYVVYGIFTITPFFVFCYVGETLIAESTEISYAFYEIQWYDLAPEEAKAFLFICHRTKTPLQINAGKFCTFTMDLFKGVMKTSMGYISVLTAMSSR